MATSNNADWHFSDPAQFHNVTNSANTQPGTPCIRRKPVAYNATNQVVSSDESNGCLEELDMLDLPPQHQPQKDLTLLGIWWQEVLACVLVVTGLVAIFATLIAVHDKPLPNLPFRISVNTLIAIFATVLKAAAAFVLAEGLSQEKWSWFARPRRLHDFLTYDNASRGPWGAFQLLLRLRCRPIIASLGAIVIIAATLVDPLSQQLVQFHDCTATLPQEAASLPRTRYFDEIGGRIGAAINAMSAGFIGSLATGQFSNSPPLDPFVCTSGNCTFKAEYSTTGYCSECIDVSDRLQWIENLDVRGDVSNITFKLKASPQSGHSSDYDILSFVAGGGMDQLTRFAMSGGSLTSMAWFDGNETLNTAHAFECTLSPCMHTIHGNVINGTLHEEILQRGPTFRDLAIGPYITSTIVDLACVDNTARQDLRDLGYVFKDDIRWLQYNVSANPYVSDADPDCYSTWYNMSISSFQTEAGKEKGFYEGTGTNWTLSENGLRIVPQKCMYQALALVWNSMEYYFEQYFTGNVTDSFYNSGVWGSMIPLTVYEAGAKDKNKNGSLEQVQDLMQNITDSMTTYMRWHGNTNMSEPVIGIAEHNTICVHVRWGWLAYDAGFVILLLLFFLAMAFDTRLVKALSTNVRHNFKSSALANLFHGFDKLSQEELEHIGSSNAVKELEDAAKERLVTLRLTEHGLKLSHVS